MVDRDYLSPHCQSENCSWCRERRRRARAQSIADAIAMAKPSTAPEHWNRKIEPSRDLFDGPYPGHVEEAKAPAFDGRGIRYLRDPADRTGHRRRRP